MTTTYKAVITVLAVLLLVFLSLSIYFFMLDTDASSSKSRSYETCKTTECKAAATQILQKVNISADPCEDFAAFACGGFRARSPLSDVTGDGNPAFHYLDTLLCGTRTATIHLRHRLLKKKWFRNLVNAHKSCLRYLASPERTAKEEYEVMWRKIKEAEAKYSQDLESGKLERDVFSDWLVDTSGFWYDTLDLEDPEMLHVKMEERRYVYVLAVHNGIRKIHLRSKRQERSLLKLTELCNGDPQEEGSEGSGIPHILADFEEDFEMFNEQFSNTNMFLNEKEPVNREICRYQDIILNATAKIQLIRESIANISWQKYEDSFANITIGELQDRMPGINWLRTFRRFHNLSRTVASGQPTNESILFYNEQMRINGTKTTAETVAWDYTTSLLESMTPEEFRWSAYLSQLDQLYQAGEMKGARWRHQACYTFHVKTRQRQMGYLFYKYFVGNYKERFSEVRSLFSDFQEMFVLRLNSLDWLTDVTRAAAIKKAEAMDIKLIEYGDLTDEQLNEDAEIFGDFESVKSEYHKGKREKFLTMLKAYNTSATDIMWAVHELVVRNNAFYAAQVNEILFTPGIMRAPPFFYFGGPAALMYGSTGTVLGHEFIHAFDTLGRNFNDKGEQESWWSNSSLAAFKERVRCIYQQHSSRTFYGILNETRDETGFISEIGWDYMEIEQEYPEDDLLGNLTLVSPVGHLGENVADVGGVRLAYESFKNRKAKAGDELRLPGLEELDPDQMFFLAVGQNWCNSPRADLVEQNIRAYSRGAHAPAAHRMTSMVQNTKAFADAFKCKADSKMNPSDKCEVW